MSGSSRLARQSTADKIISENNMREKQFREFYRDLLATIANGDYEAGVPLDEVESTRRYY